MGLGSSPTHEVIRVLQESKKARRAATDPMVDGASQAAGGAIAAAATMVVGGGQEGIQDIEGGPRPLEARAPRKLIRVR